MTKKGGRRAIVTRKQKIAAANPSEKHGAADDSAVESHVYLENPVKPINDRRDYRVIKLPNGLTALLITRPDTHEPRDAADVDNGKKNGAKSCSPKPSEKDNGNGSRWFELQSETEEKARCVASCRLSINVGKYSDPPDYPWISTMVKNAVLTASKKYPENHGFKDCVDKCGGVITVADNNERTSYFFKVPENSFSEAVDRFAQCFVSPILKSTAVISARCAIVREQTSRFEFPEYVDRKEYFLMHLAAEEDKNPSHKLSVRPIAALVNATNKNIIEEALKFQTRHYSAHRMTVVMESRLSLDTLEEFVKASFSKIPNNGLPPDDFSRFDHTTCFDMVEWRKLYHMRPVSWRDINKIELNWPMPPPHQNSKCKPLQYLSWILRNEGEGSLISCLRKKQLCIAIKCDIGGTSLEENSVYSILNLSLILTDGPNHVKTILDVVYSYINMMKREGPQERIYNEIRAINEAKLRSANCDELMPEIDASLCDNMHVYEPSEYLIGGFLYSEYDPSSIQRCMDLITPDRANIIVYDRCIKDIVTVGFDEEATRIHSTHQMIVHPSTEISENWLRDWTTMEPLPELRLPAPNVFLADDFALIQAPKESSPHPVNIHSDEFSEIWYKPDMEFRRPECCINYCFTSALPSESAVNACMMELFAKVLRYLTFEQLYAALVAGSSVKIQTCELGLVVQGYASCNQKLPIAMEAIARCISRCSKFVSHDAFQLAKSTLLNEYDERLNNPNPVVDDAALKCLKAVHWTLIDRRGALPSVKIEQFRTFLRSFTDRVYVRCLAQGNIKPAEVIENARKCIELLDCKSQSRSNIPQLVTHEIPRGKHSVRIDNVAPNSRVTTVIKYYQFEDKSIEQFVLIEFLILLMGDPLFVKFVDLENICSLDVSRSNSDVPGYSISKRYYHEDNSTIAVAEIEAHIDYSRKSMNTVLRFLDPEELLEAKKTFERNRARNCGDFVDEVSRNWSEIVSGHYTFDRRVREMDFLRNVAVDDLRRSLMTLTADGPDVRTLSVQVIATNATEENSRLRD